MAIEVNSIRMRVTETDGLGRPTAREYYGRNSDDGELYKFTGNLPEELAAHVATYPIVIGNMHRVAYVNIVDRPLVSLQDDNIDGQVGIWMRTQDQDGVKHPSNDLIGK